MSQKSLSSRLTYIKSISLEIDYLEFVAEKGDNSLGKAGCWLASLERLSSQIKLNCQLFIFLALQLRKLEQSKSIFRYVIFLPPQKHSHGNGRECSSLPL